MLKKGRRKVGEGERSSSRVGLLLGLCLGLMACSMRPFPSFNMCFCRDNKGTFTLSCSLGLTMAPVCVSECDTVTSRSTRPHSFVQSCFNNVDEDKKHSNTVQ